jgi:hypothetical protein
LQVIELKRVHEETEPLAEFLGTHFKSPLRINGSRIEIEKAEHDEVKLLIHKYLHQRRLSGYKVHSQSGVIEIIPHDKQEGHRSRKGTEGRPPTAPETMPYFFPGHAYT